MPYVFDSYIDSINGIFSLISELLHLKVSDDGDKILDDGKSMNTPLLDVLFLLYYVLNWQDRIHDKHHWWTVKLNHIAAVVNWDSKEL